MAHDDVRYFGWITADVSRLMRTVFDRRVRSLGLTRTQWLALVRAAPATGRQSVRTRRHDGDREGAGRAHHRSARGKELDRAAPDPADRRVNRIYLTALGERIHAAITPIAEATVNDALSGLSSADRRRVTQLMARVKLKLGALAEVGAGADNLSVEDIEREDQEEARVQ